MKLSLADFCQKTLGFLLTSYFMRLENIGTLGCLNIWLSEHLCKISGWAVGRKRNDVCLS